jgi:hypothetical protein
VHPVKIRSLAWPRQAFDEAGTHGIDRHREHDWHDAGGLLRPRVDGVVVVTITSGASATNSAACMRNLSI